MRRKRQPAAELSGNVNANLVRLSTDDLYTYAETALMTGSYHLSQWRSVHRVIDNSHLDQAIMQTEWALEGLRALRSR